jgi:general L-amino acid transport system substrate-binding protein
MMTILKRLLLLVCISLLMSVARAQIQPTPTVTSPTLAAAQARGQIICGIDEEVFGFGFLNPNTGDISGIQVDFCRALAAAAVGEAQAVGFRLHPLDSVPTDLAAEGVDVLFHHTFIPRLQTQAGVDIGSAIIFYDGTTVMLEGGDRPAEWTDLNGSSICVVNDSASALDFAAEMSQRDLIYDEISWPSVAEMRSAFFSGVCSAQVFDRTILEIMRFSTTTPDAYTVWPVPFTRRAITPLYPYGDATWGSLVDWTLWGLIQAEKLGVNSENIDTLLRRANETADDYTRRVGQPVALLIDAELGLGSSLGVANGYMAGVIRQVGNYGEIYERHLGPESTLPIERGLNDLWANGGLLDAPAWQ